MLPPHGYGCVFFHLYAGETQAPVTIVQDTGPEVWQRPNSQPESVGDRSPIRVYDIIGNAGASPSFIIVYSSHSTGGLTLRGLESHGL
ncbi:hypothetical protein [Methanoregula sp.]|uniref:hypothetical protein n=1 Tax=Methanoregula sp. TaxID=2052170 RepID=UPI003565C98A